MTLTRGGSGMLDLPFEGSVRQKFQVPKMEESSPM